MNQQKNVILILSDDHGYGDRSVLGIDPAVSTPALDRLAAEGVTHSDGYVTAPICSPSRAGLISGVHQLRWGAEYFGTASFAPPSLPTLAERFQQAGYRTGYVGKVHYGIDPRGERPCPDQHGFDETLYALAGEQFGRINYLRHSSAALQEYGAAAKPMAVAPMIANGEADETDGFTTWRFGQWARDFIERANADGQPFFVMVAFNAVHNFCWQLPPEELAKRNLPARTDWDAETGEKYPDWYDRMIVPNLDHGREYYLAQLELMDAEIGSLLDQLDTLGLSNDTVVSYTTDNGGSTCNYGSNAPLRGTKYGLWEGGVRVPLIVRWPGEAPAGATVPGLSSSLDLTPTLLRAAGVSVEGLCDGRDLAELWKGGAGHEALHWSTGWSWAVRQGDWKLSWVDPQSSEAEQLRTGEHAEIGSGYFLANVATDIGEQTNLVDSHPDEFAQLKALHEEWMVEMAASQDELVDQVPAGWRTAPFVRR